ncbi:hypothetical protein INT43_001798 [Umbelopsis isabellina]|uniref:Beta-lactamase-related domain-containing protein n=1 Tax=Mortierella isabellina TaxID=91625 RepID=A0A8H7PTH1_MORIS|nr:hypothetical protein INT43_001798 [Umbelopsis isabellina]
MARTSVFLLPIIAWLAFKILDKNDFTPYSCALLNLNCPVANSSGYVAPNYANIKPLFEENFAKGDDVGASVAVYVDGELKVNLVGGYSDREAGKPYTNETLQIVFSCTKVMASIVVARLVAQGRLSYSEKISTYWPEFAQGNKQDVTLKDLMEHAGGVAWLDEPLSLKHFDDMDKLSERLAKQPHNYNGTKTRAYEAYTIGWYVNEIVRRVDPQHRTIGQIVDQEINGPYGVDWHLSPSPDLDDRIAKPYQSPLYRLILGLITPAWLYAVAEPLHEFFISIQDKTSPAYKALVLTAPDGIDFKGHYGLVARRYENPSTTGFTNARSIAKIASVMANRGQPTRAGEPVLIPEETYELATKTDLYDFDLTLRMHVPMTIGGFGNFEVANTTFTGWIGAGGSSFYWNEELKLGFGYSMNGYRWHLGPDRRSLKLIAAAVEAVRKEKGL